MGIPSPWLAWFQQGGQRRSRNPFFDTITSPIPPFLDDEKCFCFFHIASSLPDACHRTPIEEQSIWHRSTIQNRPVQLRTETLRDLNDIARVTVLGHPFCGPRVLERCRPFWAATAHRSKRGSEPDRVPSQLVYLWRFGTSFSFSAFCLTRLAFPPDTHGGMGVHLDEMAGYATRNIDSRETVYISRVDLVLELRRLGVCHGCS